jgi:hypothetical protein
MDSQSIIGKIGKALNRLRFSLRMLLLLPLLFAAAFLVGRTYYQAKLRHDEVIKRSIEQQVLLLEQGRDAMISGYEFRANREPQNAGVYKAWAKMTDAKYQNAIDQIRAQK